ncbi:hypothetical protein RRG08_042775 [Elysia crispata]|uniref:Uncharacterized protein n=1 Tax=Elysia crispata TaxID=231223 RepID=A0AAE0XQC3_9GAST|nr:hypothetical protein RRG08_042775 [Elysia crispata]
MTEKVSILLASNLEPVMNHIRPILSQTWLTLSLLLQLVLQPEDAMLCYEEVYFEGSGDIIARPPAGKPANESWGSESIKSCSGRREIYRLRQLTSYSITEGRWNLYGTATRTRESLLLYAAVRKRRSIRRPPHGDIGPAPSHPALGRSRQRVYSLTSRDGCDCPVPSRSNSHLAAQGRPTIDQILLD